MRRTNVGERNIQHETKEGKDRESTEHIDIQKTTSHNCLYLPAD